MLCENCGKNEASFHSRTNVNGVITEVHLCEDCATKSGVFENSMRDLSEFFNNDFSHEDFLPDLICDFCGTSFKEFKNSGLLGCEHCYDAFAPMNDIIKSVQNGADYHVGKTPLDRSEITRDEKIEELREEINRAVDKEDYELAAKLKKQIENLQNGENNGH